MLKSVTIEYTFPNKKQLAELFHINENNQKKIIFSSNREKFEKLFNILEKPLELFLLEHHYDFKKDIFDSPIPLLLKPINLKNNLSDNCKYILQKISNDLCMILEDEISDKDSTQALKLLHKYLNYGANFNGSMKM